MHVSFQNLQGMGCYIEVITNSDSCRCRNHCYSFVVNDGLHMITSHFITFSEKTCNDYSVKCTLHRPIK